MNCLAREWNEVHTTRLTHATGKKICVFFSCYIHAKGSKRAQIKMPIWSKLKWNANLKYQLPNNDASDVSKQIHYRRFPYWPSSSLLKICIQKIWLSCFSNNHHNKQQQQNDQLSAAIIRNLLNRFRNTFGMRWSTKSIIIWK